ncbi:SRP40, C-terminal domain-containing protein [Lineolata rhizophorae]|uniref:SRP40, C-terminal domain-containing protein n=1 Tax=Lineolata rhizophorae TaxID=578093 RepID=A0A6A6PAZ0_9PEZI|nr:SRP40, C-terminal domain-containing protein [Lineolata rhizophorae]
MAPSTKPSGRPRASPAPVKGARVSKKSSSRTPTTNPLAGLVHRFLQDNGYAGAASELRKSAGANLESAATELPSLAHVFAEWQKSGSARVAPLDADSEDSTDSEDSSSTSESESEAESEASSGSHSTVSTKSTSEKASVTSTSESSTDSSSSSESGARVSSPPSRSAPAPARASVSTSESDSDSDSGSDSDSDSDPSSDSDSSSASVASSSSAAAAASVSASASSEPESKSKSSFSSAAASAASASSTPDSSESSSSSSSGSEDADEKKLPPILKAEPPKETPSDSSVTMGNTSPAFDNNNKRQHDIPSDLTNKRIKKGPQDRFHRIPTSTVVDKRFASNAYVPYDYADRAYQDLSITKGKGFTKEKNKKKRGSYRGGAIDTHGVKSIKFED